MTVRGLQSRLRLGAKDSEKDVHLAVRTSHRSGLQIQRRGGFGLRGAASRGWKQCCVLVGVCCTLLWSNLYSKSTYLVYEHVLARPTTILDQMQPIFDIGWAAVDEEKPLSPRDMFVALSNMLPDHHGLCPDLPGYPASSFRLLELRLCDNLLRRAIDRKECIIYNFGVGPADPFLKFMGSNDKYHDCQVFAFDPFYPSSEVPNFGPNVHFYHIGLWNGHSPKQGLPEFKNGTLKSLPEIQAMLNHTPETKITFFRSDCEGCEYGWVKHAMDNDPTFFERIGQMFIEIHTVHIQGLPALDLPWENGEPPADLLEPVYRMLTQNFRVLESTTNPGYPTDRNSVSMHLRLAGVLGWPCCREFNLVNARYAAPPKSNNYQGQHCQQEASSIGSAPESLDGFSDTFTNLFRGRKHICTEGEAPKCFGDKNCFCPLLLKEAEKTNSCLIYFFANLASSQDVEMLHFLSKNHPKCAIHAFDPRWTEEFWDMGIGTMKIFGGNVHVYPWGMYSGSGPRAVKTIKMINGNETEAPGELYTMAEITRGWAGSEHFFSSAIPNLKPDKISLLRIDWSNVAPCVWEKEVLTEAQHWWGSYSGDKSVKQLM